MTLREAHTDKSLPAGVRCSDSAARVTLSPTVAAAAPQTTEIMSDTPTPPAVPEERLTSHGWALVDERSETVFELPTMRVRGVTRRFEDERSAELLEEAGSETDHPVRFFAVSRLAFDPPLPPGIGTSMVAPTVRTEAKKTFAKRLERRGLEDVSRDRRERFRLPDRTRVRLWRYTATLPSEQFADNLPLECWLGVWLLSDAVFVVTGGHPTVALSTRLSETLDHDALTRSPGEYRDEFFKLLRATGRQN